MSSPVRGFKDLLPPASERAAALEALARAAFARYGYREARLPTVENRELFEKSTGESTDIVEKEMFAFEDQGGRKLALRPEGTPGVVRAYLDKHLSQQGPVSKLYYIGSMFRAERPQAGRYREFEQIGAECIGNPHPAADAESILLLKAFFDEAGLRGRTRLRLNNLGCESPDCRPAFRAKLLAYLKTRAADLCENCRRRMEKNPLRVLDCKGDGPKLAAEAPKLAPCAACAAHVGLVRDALAQNGCAHSFDPSLVRGLDYYTRTVFEFTAEGVGAQDAIAGGGRYDGLVAAMGGPSVPAVGWALGLERTLLALGEPAPEEPACDVFLVLQSKDPAAAAAGIAALESLRRAGLRAEGGLFASSLKAQMKEASRRGARLAAIIGEDEFKKDPPSCVLKDMKDERGSERVVALSGLAAAVRGTVND